MRHERQQTQAFTYRLLIIVIATIIGASDCLLELVAFQRGHPLLRDAPDAPEVRQLVKDCWIGVFNAGGNANKHVGCPTQVLNISDQRRHLCAQKLERHFLLGHSLFRHDDV